MAEQKLDNTDVGALLEKVNGKCVRGMRHNRFWNLASSVSLALMLHCVTGDVLAWQIAGEEPVLGSFEAPPVTKSGEQLGREHHVAIFFPLPCSTRKTMRLHRWQEE